MKKIIVTIAFALVLCSCEGILNTTPKSKISDGNMWTTPSLSKAGMDGLMYTFHRRGDYQYSISTLMPGNGQGGLNRLGMEGLGYTSLFDGTIDLLKAPAKKASGIENNEEWMSMFSVVHACNKAIGHLKPEVVGKETYEQYICEARMLRAYAYSRLNMIFGSVPVYLEEVDNVNCNKSQSSWREVWDMIIKECTECIENPNFQTNNFTGDRLYKPSKGMAYAIRGNAYMWLAANKDPEQDEMAVGPLSDTEIEDFYKKASADFASLKECGFGLFHGETWESFFTEANDHNCEMIFPLEFSSSVSGYSSMWNWVIGSRTQLNGWNRLTPSQAFVDDFEWKDGTKFKWIDVIPEWDDKPFKKDEKARQVFFLRDSLDTFFHQFESDPTENHENCSEKCITLTAQREKIIGIIGQEVWDAYYLDLGNEARYRSAFDDRDPRLDKCVVTAYKPYRAFNEYLSSPQEFVLRWPRFKREDTEPLSDWWAEVSANMVYPWYKNLITDGSIPNRERDGIDWPVLRFTQFQLMWAEALLRTGDLGGAKNLLNEVRARAGMPDVTSGDPDEVLAEIQYETRVELCQEGKDFFDEIRWGTFKKKKYQNKTFTDPKSCWGAGGWKTGYYYVEGMWPLSAPLTEIVRNSNLKRRSVGWTY